MLDGPLINKPDEEPVTRYILKVLGVPSSSAMSLPLVIEGQIAGALALLAETLAAADDDESRVRLSQRLQSEASRMANVIDDVLQLAETESLGVEHVPVHLTYRSKISEVVKVPGSKDA